MVDSGRVSRSFCTTREAATMLGVSVRTAQLWVEQEILEAWKTRGGHRRISRHSIERLLAAPPPSLAFSGEITPKASPFTVMVVEDEATLRMVYEANLRRWPMKPKVISAGDGYEAMVKLGRVMPDLLIADLHMPGMDGFRMLHAIRATSEYDSMSIVVVTGLDAEEIESRGGIPDGIPVLPKPVPFDRLLSHASQLIARKGNATTAEMSA